jgi:predicted GIY-YIG superfamily endonuclease
MREEYLYYVYMMQSASRRALYIGMTNNLRKRVGAQEPHPRRLHGRLQLHPSRILGKLRRCSQRNRSRKTTKALASRKENVVDRSEKSALAGFSS